MIVSLLIELALLDQPQPQPCPLPMDHNYLTTVPPIFLIEIHPFLFLLPPKLNLRLLQPQCNLAFAVVGNESECRRDVVWLLDPLSSTIRSDPIRSIRASREEREKRKKERKKGRQVYKLAGWRVSCFEEERMGVEEGGKVGKKRTDEMMLDRR
jgi:hypothetical protein